MKKKICLIIILLVLLVSCVHFPAQTQMIKEIKISKTGMQVALTDQGIIFGATIEGARKIGNKAIATWEKKFGEMKSEYRTWTYFEIWYHCIIYLAFPRAKGSIDIIFMKFP